FLGREHEIHVQNISAYYGVEKDKILQVGWDEKSYEISKEKSPFPFQFEHLSVNLSALRGGKDEPSWLEAYYQPMDRLIPLQVEAIRRSLGSQRIAKLIVEGGFTKNQIFIALLQKYLPDHQVMVSNIK